MNLLISGCLLGLGCRYDNAHKPLPKETIEELTKTFSLIPVCPEQLGGLATPRVPAERVQDKVMTQSGIDVTEAYQKGAKEALYLAELLGASVALLKEKSPSCGNGEIYDGSFQRTLVPGDGVTTELLKNHGIKVFGESQIPQLYRWCKEKED